MYVCMYVCMYVPVCARNVCMGGMYAWVVRMHVYMYDVCRGGMYDPVYGW